MRVDHAQRKDRYEEEHERSRSRSSSNQADGRPPTIPMPDPRLLLVDGVVAIALGLWPC